MPAFAVRFVTHVDQERRRLWNAAIADEEKRSALSILMHKPTIRRSDSTKHIMIGARYAQSMAVLKDRVYWAYQALPQPESSSWPTSIKLPSKYFPATTATRTKAYTEAITNFGANLTALLSSYPDGDLSSPTTSFDNDLDTILALTEHYYTAAENAMIFPNMLAYVAGILIMNGHIKNGGTYPFATSDPKSWAFLRVEQLVIQACFQVAESKEVIRAGPTKILQTIILHVSSVTGIPFEPPIPPLKIRPALPVFNPVTHVSDGFHEPDHSTAANPPSSTRPVTLLPECTTVNMPQLVLSMAPTSIALTIPRDFPRFYNLDLPEELMPFISYPTDASSFPAWMLGSACAWVSVIPDAEDEAEWWDRNLVKSISKWLAFIRYSVRGTGCFYYAVMRDCADFDVLETVPTFVWDISKLIATAYQKRIESPPAQSVVRKQQKRAADHQPPKRRVPAKTNKEAQ
ncbi:hypothetical protein CALCODRAFT_512186 [Calocera cornea HHB12733]|uniref:Uncharacterized protein n=1 Tax=Calocera cornea HHB12733 TaxID=1353952 RepID=A0A165D7P0_9BASI|nr:hypothetical protein CALCODRAFT_512186 [Calocera cornea HHB12733]